jgi:hypothetical protein
MTEPEKRKKEKKGGGVLFTCPLTFFNIFFFCKKLHPPAFEIMTRQAE